VSQERLEQLVASFLDARESEPGLSPESYLSRLDSLDPASDGPGAAELRRRLLAALHAVIEVDRLLPEAVPLPRQIGPYAVLGELGRGGMGIVYEVERDGRRAALKLHPFSPLLAGRGAERLRREIEALRSIRHPNIVRVLDAGSTDGAPYVVMELVDGVRLDHASSSMSRDDALRVVAALARAIHAAHEIGVVHRDLKPQNVIVRHDGEPVVIDFGLSLAEELQTLTVTGELLGTPRYMAPEQVTSGEADARTDVYALGLILYELIVGRPARASSSREGLLRAAADGSMTRPRRLDRSIPTPLELILRTALAPVREDRYPTALELAEDLERLSRGEAVRPRAGRWFDPEEHLGQRRRRGVLAFGIASALTACIAALLWSGNSRAAARRAESTQQLRHALELYFDGDSSAAHEAAQRAVTTDRRNGTASGLAAHLARIPQAEGARADAQLTRTLLRAVEARDSSTARACLRDDHVDQVDPALRAAASGLIAVSTGHLELAERDLAAAGELLPGSVMLLERRARIYQRLGFVPRAQELLEHATTLDSTSARLWMARANLELARRDLDASLRSVSQVKRWGDSTDVDLRVLEASIRANRGQGARARRILLDLVAQAPGSPEAWYQLGYAYDMDHLLVPATAAYQRSCRLLPNDPRPRFCLANLYSGASRGSCVGCDSAFAAHPSMLDRSLAEKYLLDCLRLDRGRQEWISRSILDVALRLRRTDRVLALADSLTASDRESPGALRLLELSRRLRLSGGRR